MRSYKSAAAIFLIFVLYFISCASDSGNEFQARQDYAEVAEKLTAAIEHEMHDKHLPAFSVVLVDDQETVWAAAFGEENPETGKKASLNTVYRIGSVSKLFTDIGIMQLVEQGKIDLDAPITEYLPEFRPRNPFDKPITLRQLMSHRSGLIREPRVGNYFEDDEPTLAATVESLNNSDLIYAPESKIKYSNAGIAVVGYVLEVLSGQPFAEYLQSAVLEPMGLHQSGFAPTPEIRENLATAYMWGYDRPDFVAPTFELGMAPAGSMYAPMTDLGKFMSILFNGGKTEGGQILKPETLQEMWAPQFAESGNTGFGIGFSLSEQNGQQRVGHGGAIYGFATQLLMLPEAKIGAATVTTVDFSNTITTRLCAYALDLMAAAKSGGELPEYQTTQPVDPALAKELEGTYKNGDERIELDERYGELYLDRGSYELRLRAMENSLVVDDRLSVGLGVRRENDDQVKVGEKIYDRVEATKPEPAPRHWRTLIGEYGWDHNVIQIYEERGRLYCLIEWFPKYPLTEIDDNTFEFPKDYGLYHGESIKFTRDASGYATQFELENSVVFKRRPVGTQAGETFRITPVRPVEELREEALAASPPPENKPRQSDLVDLSTLVPTIKFDIRYATTNNFMSSVFYRQPKAFLQRPAAEALLRVHQKLREHGYGLLIHDAYRPWYVTKMFYDATPEDKKIFVANPANGSRHNRGCAVDLTLYDLQTGEVIEMPGGYDEMTDRSFPDYVGGTSLQRWHRDLLREAFESEGYRVYQHEWWHFDYKDWREYPVENLTFEELLDEE